MAPANRLGVARREEFAPVLASGSAGAAWERHRYMAQNRSGFTLIEVLIVTMVIGLLAAIALPKFAGTREKAYDASAVADLRHLVQSSEAYFADHLQYPAALADLTDWVPSKGVVVTRFDGAATEVHIHLGHQSSSHYYHINYPFDDIEKRPS